MGQNQMLGFYKMVNGESPKEGITALIPASYGPQPQAESLLWTVPPIFRAHPVT